ncbi:MAG: hypothetical protein LC119_05250 [Burkholderiales bacterium]|nr:hypothetical protein [Burkholderiales bacterium]
MSVQALQSVAHTTPAAPGARYDVYAGIHKALRLLMTRTPGRVAGHARGPR